MPSKKGSKYLNAKTYSVLSKYTPEDIQKLLNSGQFKSVIARTLGVYIGAFNVYIREHNLTYKAPCQIRYGKQYKSLTLRKISETKINVVILGRIKRKTQEVWLRRYWIYIRTI